MDEHGRSIVFTRIVCKKTKTNKKKKKGKVGVCPGYMEERALAQKS